MSEPSDPDQTNLAALEESLRAEMDAATTSEAVEAVRVKTLGKKGALTEELKKLASLPPDARKAYGAAVNAAKERLAARLAEREEALAATALAARLAAERADLTLPARPLPEGRIHPISQTIEEVLAIFARHGFTLAEGPDIETDELNFTALNIPPDHPARQMQDSFYLPEPEGAADGVTEKIVLRTHTSPVQIRAMRAGPPPLRAIIPGRTFRCDYDQTHTPMFHQFELIAIDRDIHFGHLRGTIEAFLKDFFGLDHVKLRFRPSFFPFTEPSAEVDIGCSFAGGTLRLGEGDDWLEIMGSGMVHPNVLKNGGLDPEQWQGFALGAGIERLAMLKHGIPDLRTFYESDLRWLRHYGFAALDVPAGGLGLAR